MTFRPGPVFANLLLADEINRATPKTQSALLEAMAEHQVTVGGQTYALEEPFLVVATQNPIEQVRGIILCPKPQLDRFADGNYICWISDAGAGRADRDDDQWSDAGAACAGVRSGGVFGIARFGLVCADYTNRGGLRGKAVRSKPADRSSRAKVCEGLCGVGRRAAGRKIWCGRPKR